MDKEAKTKWGMLEKVEEKAEESAKPSQPKPQ